MSVSFYRNTKKLKSSDSYISLLLLRLLARQGLLIPLCDQVLDHVCDVVDCRFLQLAIGLRSCLLCGRQGNGQLSGTTSQSGGHIPLYLVWNRRGRTFFLWPCSPLDGSWSRRRVAVFSGEYLDISQLFDAIKEGTKLRVSACAAGGYYLRSD
jgi:hypothetical protein